MTRIENNTIFTPERGYWEAASDLWDATLAKITAFVVSLLGSNYSKVADEAQQFVSANVLFSSTFPNRNIHFRKNNTRSFVERFHGIDSAIGEVRSSIKRANCSTFDRAVAMGKAAIKYSIGNCMEMAAAAFVYLLETHPDVKVDIYHIVGGDHCFLVIGRDVNSNPIDPKTWGPHALICDPWSKKSFPVSEIRKLKDFGGNVTMNGYPILKDLDLTTQTLALWTSNHLTEKDLDYLVAIQFKANCIFS